MTRTYAARKLLEHGPLTFAEFLNITRWPASSAQLALEMLVDTGEAIRDVFPGQRRSLYSLVP